MKQVDSKSGAAAGGPTRIRLACRIWLHDGSEPVFGMTGGRGGGGSIVSDEGRLLAGSFGALVDDADALLDGLVEKHLSSWIHGADDAGADGKSGGSPARDSE